MKHQITNHLLMIRPTNFGFNHETAPNNAFQVNDPSLERQLISTKAREEFDAFVRVLTDNGIQVEIIEDTAEPVKIDAVFPNNWISFHESGTIVTYAMHPPSRRLERREDVVNKLMENYQFQDRIHLERFEKEGLFLEGTGSLILDRVNRLAYACTSPRTDEKLLDHFCAQLNFEKVAFNALDDGGKEIYHTNVMMALGTSFVVICLETVTDEQERNSLLQKFEETRKEIISITLSQMKAFAGNMLQVKNKEGSTFLVMSEQAYKSLNQEQISKIKEHTNILHSPLYTIEKYGGGSARCMMAEIFVPSGK